MINIINSFIWSIVIVLLLISGLYFTKKLNFLQLKIFRLLKPLKNKENIKALSISLGAKIGVGSLSGMAIAIYYGGVGTIFWLWICSIITSIISYVETYLGVLYKEKNESGAFYYLKNGLNNNKLAIIYAIILIIAFIGGFLTIQANTIVKTLDSINSLLVSFCLIITTAYIIFKGRKEITLISTIIVPLMMLLYIVIGLFVIINNINLIPGMIINIITSALNFKSFFTGIIIGIQRAIFATEIGTGTSIIATSGVNDSKHNQALSQLFGVHFISFIICTITAFIIILSEYKDLNLININGIEIILYAFKYQIGSFGKICLSIITILFAFSTIISGYYYGEISLKFITNINKTKIIIFKIITLFLLFLGTIINANYLWSSVDILLGILTIINIYALLKLENKIKK